MTLGVLVPTRRPGGAERLADAFAATASADLTTLIFAVDHDDPGCVRYTALASQAGHRVRVRIVPPDGPRRFGPVLNWAATSRPRAGIPACAEFTHLAAMSDDHLPRTPGWDELLTDVLDRPGVSYGNDLLRGQLVPTAAVISAQIVAALGYMTAPTLAHLCTDIFWTVLGQATHLEYLPQVIIEHMHPSADKAPVDEVYEAGGMNKQLARADEREWEHWQRETWPGERARLAAALGEAA